MAFWRFLDHCPEKAFACVHHWSRVSKISRSRQQNHNSRPPDLCLPVHNYPLYITGDYLFAVNPLMDQGILLTYGEGLCSQVALAVLSENGRTGK